MANDLQYSCGVDFDWDETDLPSYIDYLDEISCYTKRQMEFLELLPEIQKAYGSLLIWNYNKEECEMSKYAERLIMEQRITLPKGWEITPPAFFIIFTSPFLIPNAAGSKAVSRVSIQERIAIFLSGYLLVIYDSYPLFSTNCLL